MAIARRIFIFFAVNMAILITLSLILSLLGINGYSGPGGLNLQALLLLCLVFGMGGAFLSLLLSKFMAKHMMGVQVIDPRSPGDLGVLVKRVHDLARAAGITTLPEVGIYDSPEVNAFATGPTRNSALVAVSTGLLDRMNQDEVDGVLAHEISHIANGDMVTMTLVQGVVNTFIMFLARVLAFFAASAMEKNSENGRRSGGSYFMNMLFVQLFQMLLMPLGMIVVAYVSRLREYRADAGSAGLVGRAKMIAALRKLQRTYDVVNTEEPASLQTLKISGHPTGMVSLFASHPSLEDRIHALEANR